MSSYAYRTNSRIKEEIVFASDCTLMDKGKRLYCPNPDCDGHMFLCNQKSLGNTKLKPYFRATLKNHRHSSNCCYAILNFNSEEHNESKFDFEKATKQVMHISQPGQEIEKKAIKESDNLF